jgi:hypothetical protein
MMVSGSTAASRVSVRLALLLVAVVGDVFSALRRRLQLAAISLITADSKNPLISLVRVGLSASFYCKMSVLHGTIM